MIILDEDAYVYIFFFKNSNFVYYGSKWTKQLINEFLK